MSPQPGTLLLVEDDELLREIYAAKLASAGFTVHPAGDAATAKALYKEHRPELACIDARLPDGSGAELGAELAASGATVVLLTNDQEIIDNPPKGIAAALLKIVTPPGALALELERLRTQTGV